MEIEIEDSDGLPVRVRVDYDAPLELMLSELGSIPDNICPDDPRLRARLRGCWMRRLPVLSRRRRVWCWRNQRDPRSVQVLAPAWSSGPTTEEQAGRFGRVTARLQAKREAVS